MMGRSGRIQERHRRWNCENLATVVTWGMWEIESKMPFRYKKVPFPVRQAVSSVQIFIGEEVEK